MKPWQIIAIAVLVLGAFLYWKREPAMMRFLDWRTPKMTLEARQQLIAGGIEVLTPKTGAASYPVVLQFHGCAGMRRTFHKLWADIALKNGFAVMLVDSTGPRGVDSEEALETVCQGKTLLGQERAGDVLAALNLAETDSRLDTDHLVVAGWSHGAWTIMDYLTMDMERRWPAGLRRESVTAPKIDGAILFYPYCGRGALSRIRKWRQTPPMLALIAGRDSVVNAEECIAYFSAREKSGYPVNVVIYPEADHIFDDITLIDEYPEYYDETAAKDAAARYEDFLVSSLGKNGR